MKLTTYYRVFEALLLFWWVATYLPGASEVVVKDMPHGEVIEFDDVDHYVLRGKNGDEAVRQMRNFLLK